jgi:hypothetical protein
MPWRRPCLLATGVLAAPICPTYSSSSCGAVSRESTPGAKPGEEENNKVDVESCSHFFTGALRSPEREARRAFGQLLAQGRRLAIAAEAASTPYRADSPPAALLRSLYAMGETSQGPDRCAVVPLMGSRAVGSTVRL